MALNNHAQKPVWTAALSAGALWGIFESTFGYILHLLPVSLGFLFWYPAACFFLTKAYKENGKPNTVLFAAMFASAVKLLNLMLPGRIDKVINPAVSIIFEGFAIWVIVIVLNKLKSKPRNIHSTAAVLAFGGNCLWRLLFIGYLAVIVPDWMRDISVLKSSESLFRFFIVENLAGSAVVFLGFQIFRYIKNRLKSSVSIPEVPKTKLIVGLLVGTDIGLQFLLK